VNDVIVLVIVVGFFALAAAYVGWCDRIVSGGAPEPPHAERLDAEASADHAVAGAPGPGVRR
jgi:hypothetical protein